MENILNKKISDTELTERTCNLLGRYGIHTVRDLCGRSKEDIYRLHGFGAKKQLEIKSFLETNGLSFNESTYRTIEISVSRDEYRRLISGEQNCILLPELDEPVDEGDFFEISNDEPPYNKSTFKRQIHYIHLGAGVEAGYMLFGL